MRLRRVLEVAWAGAVLAAAAACAQTPSVPMPTIKTRTDRMFAVKGDETQVDVITRWDGLDPYPAAVKHCAGFGRAARFRSIHAPDRRTTFDCVARNQPAS